jgi:PAS domain S-box-containing protein
MENHDKTKQELQKELIELQREFYYLNAIKDIDTAKRIQLEQELAVALAEIDFQHKEKEKRAAELIIANLELKFQSEEKAKRAAELVIANIELVFQNKEKTKRAAELIVANKELSFQNEEKAKRAVELLIALANAEDFENKFRQIAENIDEVFWLRTDSEMIYVSPSFEKIWGVPCQAIYDNPQIFTEKIHPEDKPVVQEKFQSNEFKEHGLFEYEYRIIRADNQVRWINAKTIPIVDDSGQIIKRVGIASDITEKYQTVQELIQAKEHAEESDRLKSAFLANMSHEIRTPMNGILGFSELLKEPGLTGEKQQEYIRIIEKSGDRMLNIINEIVDISKIEANLMDVDIKNCNINEKLEFIYVFFKPQVEEKGMQLLFKNTLPTKEATIKTDNEKIYSILTNLVKNAIKYSIEGSIEFGYLRKGETLEFYVKDTGIGIPKDRQVAIFERFIQADIADKMARQGVGLGLSISKAYVEMLGGKIWVESNEGIGSTFYFTLPYNAEPEEKKVVVKVVQALDEKDQIKNLKILIADDDEISEMLITIDVKKFSREILKAGNGFEAIEVCRNNPDTDLILMDIQLPVMNGHEATRQIRQFNKDVIIIAQTAFGLSGDREKAIEAGCNDYIAKPINKDELLSLIQKYFKK